MKNILLSYTFLLFFTSIAFSQNKADSVSHFEQFYTHARMIFYEFDNLNGVLISEGFPGLDNQFAELEFGYFSLPRNKWAGGIGGYFFEHSGNVRGEGADLMKQTNLKGWGLKTMTRYYFLDGKTLKIFGQSAFGFRWQYLNLHSNTFQNPSLGFILQNSPTVIKIRNRLSPTLDLAVGTNLNFSAGFYDFFAGARFGYALINWYNDNWKLEGDLDLAMPDLKTGGFFFDIALGFSINKPKLEAKMKKIKARQEARRHKKLNKK